jgi:nucleotide-binding universal stress UspA family protein
MSTRPSESVLVALDLSPESEQVLLHGAHLAEQEDRPLRVLHVVHESGQRAGFYRGHDGSGRMEPLHDIATHMLDELLDETKRHHPDLTALQHAHSLVVDGLPAQRIVEVAEREGAVALVVAGHLHGPLERLFHRPLSTRVAERTDCPVTVVKVPARGWQEAAVYELARPGHEAAPEPMDERRASAVGE